MKFVSDVMTKNPCCITSETTLREAADKMRERSIGCLPVVDDGLLVGMITDRDIVIRAIAEGRDPRDTPARDAMSGTPRSIGEDRPIVEAAEMLKRGAVRRIVAVDSQGKPVGVLSLSDMAACKDDHDTAVAATDVFRRVCAADA